MVLTMDTSPASSQTRPAGPRWGDVIGDGHVGQRKIALGVNAAAAVGGGGVAADRAVGHGQRAAL
jgi:hypothetical protein